MGALLGAILTSSVALVVLILQVRHNRKIHLSSEQKSFYKYASLLVADIERYLDKFTHDSIKELVNEGLESNSKFIYEDTLNALKHVQSIDDNVILYDTFFSFKTIAVCLEGIEEIIRLDIVDKDEEERMFAERGLLAFRKGLLNSVDDMNIKLKQIKKSLKIKM